MSMNMKYCPKGCVDERKQAVIMEHIETEKAPYNWHVCMKCKHRIFYDKEVK